MSVKSHIIIIDLGTGYVKVGFAGEKDPIINFPITLYNKKLEYIFYGDCHSKFKNPKFLIGEEVYYTNLHNEDIIKSYDLGEYEFLEKIFKYLFEKKKIFLNKDVLNLNDYKILITSKSVLEFQVMKQIAKYFESHGVVGLQMKNTACLTAINSGINTCLVVDIGHQFAKVTPVFEACCLEKYSVSIPIAGEVIDNFLIKNLIKVDEKIMYLDFLDKKHCGDYDFELEDKSKFIAKEIIYIINYSTQKLDLDLKKVLYENVILTGGSCNLKVLLKSIENELNSLDDHNYLKHLNIITLDNPEYSAWRGGSTFCIDIPENSDVWWIPESIYYGSYDKHNYEFQSLRFDY